MKIREAEPEDFDIVVRMISALHQEVPGIVAAGPKTHAYVEQSVRLALSGSGLVLVAEDERGPAGALLAIDGVFPYDTNLGRTACGLGTYVQSWARKLGLAGALYTEARRLLTKRGYEHYLGAHLVGNDAAQRVIGRVGFEPFETLVLMHLGDR